MQPPRPAQLRDEWREHFHQLGRAGAPLGLTEFHVDFPRVVHVVEIGDQTRVRVAESGEL
ncbi:hypothetical protein A6456_08705 [Paraburkholderia tropica]|nr:hypothetical protein A6456_08705 [Paraburkholderia tropica]